MIPITSRIFFNTSKYSVHRIIAVVIVQCTVQELQLCVFRWIGNRKHLLCPIINIMLNYVFRKVNSTTLYNTTPSQISLSPSRFYDRFLQYKLQERIQKHQYSLWDCHFQK